MQTPYDQEIVSLGDQLNRTYVGYGARAEASKSRQAEQDANAASMGAACARGALGGKGAERVLQRGMGPPGRAAAEGSHPRVAEG